MAVVAYDTYNGDSDCLHTNDYVSDGHGLAVTRVNRYVSDGHGLTTLIGAHRCPADPELATVYMETLRCNYERQHFISEDRTKKAITHVQFYVSFPEDEPISAEMRMFMVQQLILRTPLQHFASIYVPHDNRPDKHIHLSVCPYSIPDESGHTHKLCMNNELLYALRREMDYICVEYGPYSIIESPELWGDPQYCEWFFRIKEQGLVKIHPPKEQDHTSFKKERKRSRRYAASKQSQALKQESQRAFYRKMTRGYTPETADFFYSPAYLYDPNHPEETLHIRNQSKDGVPLSELEQKTIAVFCWAYQAKANLISRKVPGSRELQNRLQSLVNKAINAKQLLHTLDIRTQEDLITHIKECGSDIAELKQEIFRQDSILTHLSDTVAAIERWEFEKDTEAFAWLKAHHCSTPERIAKAKKCYTHAEGRKFSAEALLKKRSTEYRHLKEAESLIRPTTTTHEWQEYLSAIMEKESRKKIGRISEESLCKQLRRTGQVLGIDSENMDAILSSVKAITAQDPLPEYWLFSEMIYQSSNDRVAAVYEKLRNRYKDLYAYRHLADRMSVIGPFSFLLFIAVCFYSGMQEIALETEIEELQQEAILQKEYTKKLRVACRQALDGEKRRYAVEVLLASDEELDACRERFIENATAIVSRLEPAGGIEGTRQLDRLITAAANRSEQSVSQPKKDLTPDR